MDWHQTGDRSLSINNNVIFPNAATVLFILEAPYPIEVPHKQLPEFFIPHNKYALLKNIQLASKQNRNTSIRSNILAPGAIDKDKTVSITRRRWVNDLLYLFLGLESLTQISAEPQVYEPVLINSTDGSLMHERAHRPHGFTKNYKNTIISTHRPNKTLSIYHATFSMASESTTVFVKSIICYVI